MSGTVGLTDVPQNRPILTAFAKRLAREKDWRAVCGFAGLHAAFQARAAAE